jgi:hypothetical protein
LEDDWAEDDSLYVQEVLGVIRQCSALMSLTMIVGGDKSRVCDVMQEACTSRSIMIAFSGMYLKVVRVVSHSC